MKTRTILLRCAALAAIALLTVAAHGQTDAWVSGMRCSGFVECGETTQVQNCIGKSQGAGCTFCNADNYLKMCVYDPIAQCNQNGVATNCGNRINGSCQPVGDPPTLKCVGSDYLGPCRIATCTA